MPRCWQWEAAEGLCGRRTRVTPCQTPSSRRSRTDPLQDTAEPISHGWGALVKTYLRKGRRHQKRREQQRWWENNKIRGRREDAPCWIRYTAKGIVACKGPVPQQRKSEKRGTAEKLLCPDSKSLHCYLTCWRDWVYPTVVTRQEERYLEWSLGKEEGWFSPSILMFAFFCFPVIKYLC